MTINNNMTNTEILSATNEWLITLAETLTDRLLVRDIQDELAFRGVYPCSFSPTGWWHK